MTDRSNHVSPGKKKCLLGAANHGEVFPSRMNFMYALTNCRCTVNGTQGIYNETFSGGTFDTTTTIRVFPAVSPPGSTFLLNGECALS